MTWFYIKQFVIHFWACLGCWLIPTGDDQTFATEFVQGLSDALPCDTCNNPLDIIKEYPVADDKWVQEGICPGHGLTRVTIGTKSLLYSLRLFDNAVKCTMDDALGLTHE